MFYEVKTVNLDEEGKEVKESWLVEDCTLIGAVQTAMKESNSDEVESAKRSSIYEVINEDMFQLEERYIVEFSQPQVNDKGKVKEFKYKVFVYAANFDDAKARCVDFLKQGYDDFKISGLNKSNIIKYIK